MRLFVAEKKIVIAQNNFSGQSTIDQEGFHADLIGANI